MNIGHIFILGLIGNALNEAGEITEKGVELLDVVEQLEALGDVDAVHVHINSQGGFVSVGDAIAELLSNVPNCHTIAEGLCASIATKIHLAVPLQNRMIEAGCQYMIHNPFISGASGDANALQGLADEVQGIENALEKMYSKATGLDKKIISGLMAQETFLTPEQCVNLKFASKITEKAQARAVALLYSNKINEMNKPNFSARIALAMAALKGETTPEAKALALKLENRQAKAVLIVAGDVTLETPFEDVAIGDPVMIGEEIAPDGSYEMTDGEIVLFMDETASGVGTVIVVVDGMISEITAAEVATGNNDEEIENLKAQLAAANEVNATLTTELTEANASTEEAVSQLEAAAKLGSTFTPPAVENVFKGKKKGAESRGISKEDILSRREARKAN